VVAALAATALLTAQPAQVAFVRAGNLVVVDVATHRQRVVMRHAGNGPVRWSGDGKLVSSGGKIAGGPTLPSRSWPGPGLAWSPTGETAAYVTRGGGVGVWSPNSGRRTIVQDGWGASTLAWSRDGRLALGRSVCHVPCGIPTHREIWVWDGSSLHRFVMLRKGAGMPMPAMWDARGRVVWWLWPDSASIAADGVLVYANARRIGETLLYPDYVANCGRGLALAAGGDRYAAHGKRIVLDGRDVSRDPSRSWVSPSCSQDGRTLVAAAGRNWEESRIGRGEHRAIWQLFPTRRQLTCPPAGWTDENPHLLADGSILFVRTHQTSRKVKGAYYETDHAQLDLLRTGTVTTVAVLTYTANELSGAFLNYYGHYDWPSRLAVSP
jgi:hypothetical protein